MNESQAKQVSEPQKAAIVIMGFLERGGSTQRTNSRRRTA